jgi:Ca2+/Na+ antiporter
MPTFHKYLGESIAAIFLILFVWGTIFWIRNKNPGTYFWGLLGLGQVLLGVQILFGVILLAMGKHRIWLHYSYGLFSVFVLYAAHRISKRFEGVEWAA